ncbi:U-box domain-containing protein 33 [Beta vulgaris subsp. vulgaris]|uniref:U-box domain-containing protein 33 n=1 Tax=Beta vulgaris subsp. vulgaris TaxID=3555 RepID=UPI002037279E|nr:U-box domain-containing protein 33 [Beta vulgaris subsp. vulgaris]
MENKIYVAVGKDVEEREFILNWALNISEGETICVIHVHIPSEINSMPYNYNGSEASQECERKEVDNMLDDCLRICALKQVPSEKLYIEKESITDGILELVSRLRITKLVMGAGASNKYSRRITKPLSNKANYVLQHAPDFCHIWSVRKDPLLTTREVVKQPSPNVEGLPLHVSEDDESDAGILSGELDRFSRSDFGGYGGSSDGFESSDQSPRVNFFQSSTHSTQAESAFSSPQLSFARDEVSESGLELLALPQTKNLHKEESNLINDLYDQLEQAITEAENSKQEAFDESIRRRKAEKEVLEISCKVKATQRLYFEELRQKEETEEELSERNKELEVTKDLLEKVSRELHQALDQKSSLESKFKNLSLSETEMLEKLLSAVDLLQLYKNRRDELQVERDHAFQEAEELRKELVGKPSSSHAPMFFSEFSFSDLEKATNYYDPSLKIGEGGYGSTYKGFLHHTEVAIKIFKPNTSHSAQEFEQEVDVLSKLRHPNLVTPIGVCRESWALVYEYFPKGSLEDRLICKDNTPPLPWQIRIQIATQLCSVLIFLHSSQPSSIIHGDLNPANILLDDNLVCKLYDFGKSCVISDDRVSMEQTTRFITSELRGTFTYIDPEFLATGELTPKSDIYSFGIILLHLLTSKPAFGIAKEVEYALDSDDFSATLDPSAGDWPFLLAEQLARMALRCCDMNPRNRPDLGSDIWRVLEPMKASSQPLSTLLLASENQAPHYFLCPIFQEMMEDPQIASDGFTYEAEAIRGWLDSGRQTSPMTNVKLANNDLIPNRALRSAIQEWLQYQRKVDILSKMRHPNLVTLIGVTMNIGLSFMSICLEDQL